VKIEDEWTPKTINAAMKRIPVRESRRVTAVAVVLTDAAVRDAGPTSQLATASAAVER
jgi:hypothetical protein